MGQKVTIRVGSDLHGYLPLVEECEILILLGDVFPWNDHSEKYQRKWQTDVFMPWLDHQPAKEKILVAGNHDFLWEKKPPSGNFHYLQDSGVDLFGLNFWGTPWTPPKRPEENRWAFRLPEKQLQKKLKRIDKSTDVLLSHGPPWGVCDWTGSRHAGSQAMLEAISRIDPRLFLCGHIHEAGGPTLVDGRLLLNATLGKKSHSFWKIEWGPEGIFWHRP